MNARGENARMQILDAAMRVASVDGLEGLTLGQLAKTLGRSKSGLFAHFDSKEALQMEILEAAADRFISVVVLPAIGKARGLPRLQALFDNWGRWAREESTLPGGCIFVTASIEYDDKEGPVRDHLVKTQRDWIHTIERAVQIAVDEGHLADDTDPEQFAYEVHSLMVGSHHYYRLLNDKRTLERAARGFAGLIERARPPASTSPESD